MDSLISRSHALVLLALLVAPLLLAGCQEKRETRLHSSVRNEQAEPPVSEPPRELITAQQAFMEVSRKVTPAVVNIRAARVSRQGELGPLFEDFFGDLFKRPPEQRKERSLGSGFVISEDGYILTNEHVVKGAEEVKVKLSDQRIYDGEVVGVDPRTDVAVLKIEADGPLPTVVFGDSDRLQVGQWSLAIGNPFGLDRTLTVGVISAIGRTDIGIEEYENFIQTDASINPGNSGGPLLNIYGEVVGINTAIVASGQGIGFAIPVNLARMIADQLIRTGEVSRGWLGVQIQPVTPELAETFGLDRVTGALVSEVVDGTPAEKAGLKRGDIILGFEDKEVRSVRGLQLLVASTPAGQTIELEVLREGERLTLPVTIAERAEDGSASAPGQKDESRQGIRVGPTPEGEGVKVLEVTPESPAARAGVEPGDLILSVNGIEVSDLEGFRAAIDRAGQRKTIRLLLRRDDTALYVAFPAAP